MSPPLLVLALAVSGASQLELVRRSFVSVSSSPDSASAVPKRNAPHGALNGGSRKLPCIEAVGSEPSTSAKRYDGKRSTPYFWGTTVPQKYGVLRRVRGFRAGQDWVST
jgi:hypothetical protein